jgi:hypothetical protein
MDELVDLRRDLDGPLGRYRRKLAYLRTQLQTGPFDEHINAEVQAIWRTEVTPALDEIRQAMADHGLARELLQALGADLSNFVKGGMLPAAAITIFSANVLDLGTALTAGLAGGSAVAPTVARALLARQRGRADAQLHDLYYVYEVRRRLTS